MNEHSLCLATVFFALLLSLSPRPASATPLFESDAVLRIQLSGPLHKLLVQADDEIELPFTLSADGVDHPVGVRLRGNSRQRVCAFPPLRLEFESEAILTGAFTGQRKLKLVTHCGKTPKYQASLLGEYAAYRVLNYLSPVSYKVRLLHVTYNDTDHRMRPAKLESYGFVIESTPELADRLGGVAVDVAAVTRGSLDLSQTALVFAFQYLIGNTDWSLVTAEGDADCCHNGDLIDIDGALHVVPYDFDLSGLANAAYAKPDASLRISNVRQRLYRGYCIPDLPLTEAIRSIESSKNEILQEIAVLPGLSDKDRQKKLRYLTEYFDKANDVPKLARKFAKRCI